MFPACALEQLDDYERIVHISPADFINLMTVTDWFIFSPVDIVNLTIVNGWYIVNPVDFNNFTTVNDWYIFSPVDCISLMTVNDWYIFSLVDFINLMAYDFHGSWNSITSFNSPLYARSGDLRYSPELSVVSVG